MPDSGDAAMLGAVVGGAVGHTMSDGAWPIVVIGAGAGLVATGHSTEDILGQIEAD